MARRLGIQYLIWNRKIWGSYSAASGWRKYTGANSHRDHVHISFTWAGARKKTSFWTGKVGNVQAAPPPSSYPTPTPTPTPTTPTTPTATPPRPTPAPAALLPAGPGPDRRDRLGPRHQRGRADHRFADRRPAVPRRGQRHLPVRRQAQLARRRRVLAHAERPDLAPGPLGAHLAARRGPPGPLRRRRRPLGRRRRRGLRGLRHPHAHLPRHVHTRPRTGRVTLAMWDPTTLSDNAGALTVRVIALTPQATHGLAGRRPPRRPASPAPVPSRPAGRTWSP